MVPDWLQWSDVVLSLIAFGLAVVTLPTAFQMWWGKPRIEVNFEKCRVHGGASLVCIVRNRPVDNRILRSLGVRSSPANRIGVFSSIRTSGTKALVGQGRSGINVENVDKSHLVDLYAGTKAWVILVIHNDDGSSAKINTLGNQKDISVEPGEYEYEFKLQWGENSIKKMKHFYVGKRPDETNWQEHDFV